MMNKKVILTLSTMLAVMLAVAQRANQIYVDLGTKGHDVSRSMYGIFFEEINHAGDGGLYAEMIQNRGFEEHALPSGMTLKDDGKAYAPHSPNYWTSGYSDFWIWWNVEQLKWKGWSISSSGCTLAKDVVIPDVPLHENTPNALCLRVSAATSNTKVIVDNSGYWGVAYQTNENYKLRFYLRTNNFQGKVIAQLSNSAGTDIGSKEFDIKADGKWNEYTATITASQTVTNGKFRLLLTSQTGGEVYVDYVSLFPSDTYKGRDNGLRRDIAETLEALHPSFMRWPGGCIVEGYTLENRVKWKETLGDPMTRRGEYSLWGYRSTYGLGYHEFLQFCEDIGMDGMFVANVGMSCSIRNGDFIEASNTAKLQPYRQDIEDAIEYAIGDPMTNEWAAKRAAAGHPEPFPLKYVELGNENGTDRYVKRYAYFYDYLKNKYPQLTFINNLSWTDDHLFPNNDMYDVHWYVEPDYFYDSSSLFDNAARGKYTVYAGEYATNNNVGQGNMDAALSEAAFIGFMERNSDLVTMASYAPLLTNVNAPNWSCNLIWYDNHQVMGRASYYVQKMYAENRPDYNVKTRIFADSQKLISYGKIGIGTWATQAKFRNLKVTSNDGTQTYYESDFKNREDEWTEASGTWKVNTLGEYIQSANGTPCLSFINAYAFRNSTLELEAMKTGGSEGFMIAFGADTTNVNTHYRINMGGWGNTQTGMEKVSNGSASSIGNKVSHNIATGRWYKIKIVMQEGDGIYCYVDDKLLLTYKTNDIFDGRVQAFGGYDEAEGEIVVKVVNGLTKPQTTQLHLNADGIQPTGKVITLKANSLTEENSLTSPRKIYPAESSFTGFGNDFEYTFLPCSFTILRIKANSPNNAGLQPLAIPAYDFDSTPTPLAEAARIRAEAINRINSLIERNQPNVITGAKGADNVQKAITKAKEVLEAENNLTKELVKAGDALETALNNYYHGLMVTTNEETAKIKNPNFTTMDKTGWSGSSPSLEHNVGEFFNTNFNTYQTLTGLENGYYLLYVQGFYRNGSQDNAYKSHNEGKEKLNAILYASTASVTLVSIYDYQFSFGSWNNYVDNREQSERAFNQNGDTYANYLVAKVTNGRLRIGLKKTVSVGNDWTCFNNFRLFLIPVSIPDAIHDINAGETQPSSQGTAIYNLLGQKVRTPQRGIFIINGKKIFIGK